MFNLVWPCAVSILNFVYMNVHVTEYSLMVVMCSFFPPVQESNYFTPQGEFRVDAGGSQTLLNCLMYKLAYFRFGEVVYIMLYNNVMPLLSCNGSCARSDP